MLAIPEEFPPNNLIGRRLLWRLLWLALSRDTLMSEAEPVATGLLNDCILAFAVHDAAAAIETIKGELEQLRLLNVCQICVLEGDDWRCVHPSSETPVLW